MILGLVWLSGYATNMIIWLNASGKLWSRWSSKEFKATKFWLTLQGLGAAKLSFERRRTTCSSVRIVGGRTLRHDLHRGYACSTHLCRDVPIILATIQWADSNGIAWIALTFLGALKIIDFPKMTPARHLWKTPFSPRRSWEVRRLSWAARIGTSWAERWNSRPYHISLRCTSAQWEEFIWHWRPTWSWGSPPDFLIYCVYMYMYIYIYMCV